MRRRGARDEEKRRRGEEVLGMRRRGARDEEKRGLG